MNINDTVNTPNGVAIYNGLYMLDTQTLEVGILVRHPKGAIVDMSKCIEILSSSDITGWLVVYRKEECHEIHRI